MSRHGISLLAILLSVTVLWSGGEPAAAAEAEAPPDRLTFDALFADTSAGRQTSQHVWSPQGDRLSYLWEDADGEALWVAEVSTGERRLLVRTADLPAAAEDGADLSIDDHHWSPGGDSVLLEATGDLFLLPLATGEVQRLTDTAEEETDPKFSPDGSRLAFVRDYDIQLLDLAALEERALTVDGERNLRLNGITDWVYWEELWGRDSTGFWWSPDGGQIAYYHFDESLVPEYPLVNFQARYPQVEWQSYPKAGEPLPRVEIRILDLEGGESRRLDTGKTGDSYLPRVDWLPGGRQIAIQRLNREQNELDLLLCDSATATCREVLTEEWPTWVNLGDELTFLDDERFIWSSERSGWKRLYLGNLGGETEVLTPGQLTVTSLDAVNADQGWVVFTGFRIGGLGAIHRQIYRQPLSGGAAQLLSPDVGWSQAVVADATGHRVETWSDADTPPRLVVKNLAGREIFELPGEPPTGFDPEALPAWEFLSIPGAEETTLPAAILHPPGASDAQERPAIMYHYGGPGSQVVANRWGSRQRGLWHKMMAQNGYTVLSVDNLGSIFFGKRGEDRLHRRFGEINLAAQSAGVDYLRALPGLDAERIGLWGWSGGGANTLYSVLHRPGVWRAAVAGAPVTDWHLYDAIWTERYLDHPEDNPQGYEASSAITHADRLADRLLIVHGTGDDNVHPQNSLVMAQKLIEAGALFESVFYPRQKHGFRGPHARHFYEKMTDFFDRYLDGE